MLAANFVHPVIILVLCAAAGIGTLLLLPGRGGNSVRRIGGTLLVLALAIFGAVLIRGVAGAPEPAHISIYFWIFAAVALLSSIRVITHPRPVYSALYFVLTVVASAGLFILLSAEFMAAALVLIYAGAILVTYVFVIMLAQQASAPDGSAGLAEYDVTSREPLVASTVGFALMGVLIFVIFDRAGTVVPESTTYIPTTTRALGEMLFGPQLLSVELAGLILTVAMVGATSIARRRIVGTPGDQLPFESTTVSTPATPIDDDPHSIPVYGTDNPRQKAYPER